MELKVKQQDQVTTITVQGDITIFEAMQFHQQLAQYLQSNPDDEKLILDLGQVEEFDTAGLQILLSLQQTLRDQQRKLLICDPSTAVRELSELMAQTTLLNEDAHGS